MEIFLLLLFVLILWLPQNIQHEGMHAIIAKLFGAEEVKIYPLPTWGPKSWIPKYFAYMTYRNLPKDTSDFKRGFISCAPQIANTLVIAFVILANIILPLPAMLSIFLFALILVNFIDGATNLGSLLVRKEGHSNDAWDAIKHFKISTGVGRIMVFFWYLILGIPSLLIFLG